MKTTLRLLAPLFAATAAACSSTPDVNIGEPIGAALSDYAASWDGYAETHQFDDGSDRVRLRIGTDGTGTLEIGDSAHVAAASDPNVGYPPRMASQQFSPATAALLGFYAGFDYPLHDTHVDSRRLRFGVSPADLYAGWCALQQPVSDGENGGYNCVPNSPFATGATCTQVDPATNEEVAIDCGKLGLCALARVCACTASGCAVAAATPEAPIQVDAALNADGTELIGTLLIQGERITIRMTR